MRQARAAGKNFNFYPINKQNRLDGGMETSSSMAPRLNLVFYLREFSVSSIRKCECRVSIRAPSHTTKPTTNRKTSQRRTVETGVKKVRVTMIRMSPLRRKLQKLFSMQWWMAGGVW